MNWLCFITYLSSPFKPTISPCHRFLKYHSDAPPTSSPHPCCTVFLPEAICQLPLNKPQISPEIYSCCVCASVPPLCVVPIGSIAVVGRFSEARSLMGVTDWRTDRSGRSLGKAQITDHHGVQTVEKQHFKGKVSNVLESFIVRILQ